MARRPRRRRVRLGLPIVVLLLVLAYFLPKLPWQNWLPLRPRTPVTIPSLPTVKSEWRFVKRAVDGDTIVLDGGERVRLIGVDIPETKHPTKPVQYFGKEALAFTKRMVEGKWVRLEFDQANAHLGYKDRYKRTLAYVFLEDGTLLNAEIIRQGYGHAYTHFPFARMEEFRQYEREAREAERGLWH